MLCKLVYVDEKDSSSIFEEFKGVVDPHYNSAPVGLVLLSEAEFAQSAYFSYSYRYMENRQFSPCVKVGDLTISDGTLYYMHDNTGFMCTSDYWKGKVYWFKFGCEHSYRDLSPKECVQRNIYHAGRCYHVSECTKCGHINSVDSSD